MNATKILSDEIESLKVSSLPARPTAPKSFGGMGYSSSNMKLAFDNLPLFIIERFNLLIDDISSTSFAEDVKLKSGYSLKDLYSDMLNGNMADMLRVLDGTVASCIQGLRDELNELRLELASLSGKDAT